MRTADDLIARAETDKPRRRAHPAVGDRAATSRSRRRPPRGCASSRSSRSRTAVERADALPAIERFLNATPDVELVWLSDGVDLGKAQGLRGRRSSASIGARPITVVDGGIEPARALAAADNAAGGLTVKVLRTGGGGDTGVVRALDLKGLPLGEARFAFKAGRARDRGRRSICRSRSATTSRGWKSPPSARPARCSCSTSAGAGAPSASSPARPPTPRSRCSPRPIISRARSTRSPTCASPKARRAGARR